MILLIRCSIALYFTCILFDDGFKYLQNALLHWRYCGVYSNGIYHVRVRSEGKSSFPLIVADTSGGFIKHPSRYNVSQYYD